jgi:hypothetical protein
MVQLKYKMSRRTPKIFFQIQKLIWFQSNYNYVKYQQNAVCFIFLNNIYLVYLFLKNNTYVIKMQS